MDLSRAAVDNIVDKALTNDVFPESTWPKTPKLIFKTLSGSKDDDSLAAFLSPFVFVPLLLLMVRKGWE